jgi:hypothetical protein
MLTEVNEHIPCAFVDTAWSFAIIWSCDELGLIANVVVEVCHGFRGSPFRKVDFTCADVPNINFRLINELFPYHRTHRNLNSNLNSTSSLRALRRTPSAVTRGYPERQITKPLHVTRSLNPHLSAVATVTPVRAPSALSATVFHEAHRPRTSITGRDNHAPTVDEGFVFLLFLSAGLIAPRIIGRRLREGGRKRTQSTPRFWISDERSTSPSGFTEARHRRPGFSPAPGPTKWRGDVSSPL